MKGSSLSRKRTSFWLEVMCFSQKRDAIGRPLNSFVANGHAFIAKGTSLNITGVPFVTNGHYLKEKAIAMETDRVRGASRLVAFAPSRV